MKILIEETEEYPFYRPATNTDSYCEREVEVIPQTAVRWNELWERFWEMQEQMKALYEHGKKV